jgi:hypothetical protein
MRPRLSDAAAFAVLAEHYRTQAETCLQMARMTVSPYKDGWSLAKSCARPEMTVEVAKFRNGRPDARG